MTKEIIVLQDSREQKGWQFDKEEKARSGYKSQIIDMKTVALDAADYSLEGYEDIIRIEKKSGFTELFGNFTPAANKERFIREMQKLKDIKHKYLVIEGVVNTDIFGMSLQQFKYPVPCSALIKWILELQLEFGIVPIFAGNAGKKTTRILFENIVKKYG